MFLALWMVSCICSAVVYTILMCLSYARLCVTLPTSSTRTHVQFGSSIYTSFAKGVTLNELVQCSTIQYNALQYNTMQYNTIQCNTIQCSTIQYTMQYNAMQFNTIQCSTIQCNTIQCSTMQYSEVHLRKSNLLTGVPDKLTEFICPLPFNTYMY